MQAGFAITVPVTVFLVAVWILHYATKAPGALKTYGVPVGAVLILGSSFTPQPVLSTGVVLAGLIAAAVIARCFDPAPQVPSLR